MKMKTLTDEEYEKLVEKASYHDTKNRVDK